MYGIIGTIEASAVIHGGGLARGLMADESGVARAADPVVWDNPEATPEFSVIGYAVDRDQAIDLAHWFADTRREVFVELRQGSASGATS